MKTDSRALKVLSIGFALLFSLFLVSCGSDSGSSSSGGDDNDITYSGTTTQATIDETNAEDLSRGAYENGEFGTTFNDMIPASLTKDPPGKSPISSRLLGFIQVLENIIQDHASLSESSTLQARAAQTEPIDEDGSCGGHLTGQESADSEAGTFSAEYYYDNYCEGAVLLDGSMSLDMALAPDDQTFFTVDFVFDLLFESGGESITMEGSISFDADSSLTVLEMVMNVLLEDPSGKVFWIKDYTWTITDNGTHSTVDISGRFYHPNHGYVDIDTPQPFVINTGADSPSSGVLVVTGKDNTKARLTVLATDSYLVEVDIGDGNGYVPVAS